MSTNYIEHISNRQRRLDRQRMQSGREDPTNTLAYRVEQILTYSPEMGADPQALLALAQSPIPTEAIGRASIEAMTRVDYSRIVADRRRRTPAEQRALWEMDDPARRQMLRDAGYSPPDEEEGKSWFRLGIGVPTFVPLIGGRHVTLRADHDNPLAQGLGGALTAAAMPFKAWDRTTRYVGGKLFDALYWGQEAVTGLARAQDRSSWDQNFAAAVAFDRELRHRVERQIGQVDDATWRATVETIINTPDGAEQADRRVFEALRGFDPQAAERIRADEGAMSYLRHFRQRGGMLDERVREVAEEAAQMMRSEGISDSVSYWDAYKDTFNGEAYVPPARRIEVLEMLDGDFEMLRLAEDVMVGKSLDEIVGEKYDPATNPEGFLEGMRQVQQMMGGDDPEARGRFDDAVQRLSLGRYSVGREAARSMGFSEGTGWYNVVSGAFDALTILTADPTLGLGKAYRGMRGIAWVTKELDKIDDVYHTARAALGLAEEGTESWGRALVDVATNDENFKALRIAGESGMTYQEATRILGDRVTWLSRADYERMMRDMGARSKLASRARSFRERGAISQWLAAERIATAFRRAEAAEDGVRALERVSKLDNAELTRALRSGEIDSVWNLSAMGDLTQDLPHITGGLGDLIAWNNELATTTGRGIRSAEDVFAFYRSSAGHIALSQSRVIRGSNTWLRNGFELPRLTMAGRRRIQAKAWFNDVIDWTQDASITIDGATRIGHGAADFARAVQQSHVTLRVADRLIGNYMNPAELTGWRRANIIGRGAAKTVRMFGDFVHSITTMLPLSTQLHLANEGFSQGVVAFERFAELGRLGDLPAAYRRLALDEFIVGKPAQLGNRGGMLPASAATRGILFRGMIGDLADRLGIADNPAMRQYLEGHGVRVYAPKQLDAIEMHGVKVPAAIVPGVQMSDALAIPDFSMLMHQARREGFMRKAFGLINHPIVDRFFTSYWRPAMLLRLGFIPRAAGEELLTYAARHGIADYMVHVAASYASNTTMPVKRMLANGDEVWDIVPRQLIGARKANEVVEWLSRQAIVAERLALSPFVDRLHQIGNRLPRAKALARRLEDSFTRTRPGILPAQPRNTHRVWIIKRGDNVEIYDSLAEANMNLWRRHSELSFADVPLDWMPHLDDLQPNVLKKANPVKHQAIFMGPLETPLVISRWMAEKASALPRQLVAKVLPDDLVESARIMRTAQQMHRELDKSAMELATLAAVRDAVGRVDGVGGGRFHGGLTSRDDLIRVPQGDGEVILRFSREFREVGAEDQMFNAKVANALNALLDRDSWAVRAGIEAVGGKLSTSQVRKLENVASQIMGREVSSVNEVIHHFNSLIDDLQRGPAWRRNLLRDAVDEGLDAPATWIPPSMVNMRGTAFRPGDTITIGRIMGVDHELTNLARHWDSIPAEVRALIAEGKHLEISTHDEIMRTLTEGMRRAMDDPAHAYEISRAQRMTVTSDGRPAAMLQPEHTHRVYVPMLDDATTEQLLSLHEFNYNQLVNRVMQSDADPSVIAYVVDEILPYLNTNDVDAARTTAMQIGRGGSRPTLPIGIRASYSPDLARDASTLLASVVDEMVTGGPRVVRRQGTYGIIERVPGFDYGHHRLAASGRYADTEVLHLTRVDTAGRITPIDPSTEVVRYSRHADANGLYVLDDHGDIVVEGVGPDVLLNDWAEQLTKVVAHHLVDNDGGLLHQITGPAMRRRIRETDVVKLGENMPERIIHQHLVLPDELSEGAWTKIVNYGFDQVIGPGIRSIIRNPMFVRAYHQARQTMPRIWDDAIEQAITPGVRKVARQLKVEPSELIPLRREWQEIIADANKRGANITSVGDELEFLSTRFRVNLTRDELAQLDRFVDDLESFHTMMANHTAAGAVNAMVPYIDDHRFKSQFAEHIRNLAPFWFAEETFLKRWARTLKHSPEAFRRAQLYVGALENVGVIDRDQYGQQVINFPGGQIIQDVLRPVTKHFFGGEMTIPLSVPFAGQVQYAMPGLDRQGLPSFSPLVAVPFGTLTNMYPELMSVETTEALFGVRSLNRGLLDQVIPSWAARVITAAGAGGLTEERMAALSIQAIQQMEAEGQRALHEAREAESRGDHEAAERHRERAAELMFPATSDPYQIERYTELVENWARNLMISQAVLGFITPATPVPQFDNEITQQFLSLTRAGMPFEEALGYMLAQDPGATPFTRFGTKSTTGAVIPAHMEAGRWVEDNLDWLNSWRHAASWAIPQPTADSEFDSMVYYQQLHLGLRERKTPAEFLEEIKFAEAAPLYFASQRNYEREKLRLRQLRDEQGEDVSERLDELEVAWQAWQTTYLNQHPLFAHRLTSNEGKQQRERTISEMRLMLADPQAPEIPHRQQLTDMLDSYDELNRLLGTVHGRSDREAQEFRHQVRSAFMEWAESYIVAFPSVMTFYRSVIEPEAGLRNTVLMQEIR